MTWPLKLIALIQILSLFMFFGILSMLVGADVPEGSIVRHVIFALMYLLVASAGFLLWRGTPAGVTVSMVVQAAQLVTFDLRVAFQFTGAIDFFVYHRSGEPGIGFDAYLGSRYAFTIYDEAGPWMIGVNVVAIIFLSILIKAKRLGVIEASSDELLPVEERDLNGGSHEGVGRPVA